MQIFERGDVLIFKEFNKYNDWVKKWVFLVFALKTIQTIY